MARAVESGSLASAKNTEDGRWNPNLDVEYSSSFSSPLADTGAGHDYAIAGSGLHSDMPQQTRSTILPSFGRIG